MSEIIVNFDPTPNLDPGPCYLNAHRWAWLVDGRQVTAKVCTRCYGNVRGDAAIGNDPYCHPDEGNSCYEDQLTENFVLKVVTEQGYADHYDVAAARNAAIAKLIAEGFTQ